MPSPSSSKHKLSAITPAILLFFPLLTFGDTISTWNGGIGNWSTASNWTPAAVPGSASASNADVTINTGADDVTLDFSPVIASFTLGGTAGSSILEGPYAGAPLTVSKSMTVGSSGSVGPQPFSGLTPFSGPITVSRNLANAGNIYSQGNLLVGGNLTNTGGVLLASPSGSGSGSNLFNVGGTLLNQGNLLLGNFVSGGQEGPGPTTTIGKLVNQGNLNIGIGTLVTLTAQPQGITDIASGSSMSVYGTINAGSQNAFAHLTSIRGSLTLENGSTTNVTPIGGTLGGSLVIGDFTGIIVHGNFVGGGLIGDNGLGGLGVTGTLTNVQQVGLTVLDGGIGAAKFINYGGVRFISGSSQVGELDNQSSLVIHTTGPLGASLVVGSGSTPPGFTGYEQTKDGILDVVFGTGAMDVGYASLNGTLNFLPSSPVPSLGETFMLIDAPLGLTGIFADVEGSIIDGGLEKLVLTYDYKDGTVDVTAEANVTPEPSTFSLLVLPFAAALCLAARRRFTAA